MRHVLLIGVAMGLWAATASGQLLRAVSYRLVRDDARGAVAFEVNFNRPPDFRSIGPGGAQTDSFQFFLDTLPGNNGLGGGSPLPWETIVRGEEIHEYAMVPVRDHILGPSSQPGSGGWGPVVTMLDYDLAGTRMTFRATYESLGTPDGRFRYELHLYQDGSWTGRIHAGSTLPGPASLPALIAGVALAARRRRAKEPTPRSR